VLLVGAASADAARVVTLAPHLAELVCAAGACDQLVAVSAYSDYPAPVKKLPQIGDGFSVSYERLLALKPDKVFAWDGGTPPATIARLRQLGLPVESLAVSGLDDVAAALERIGATLGTADAARTAADSYRSRLAQLRARWHDATPIRVVYQIGTTPAYSIGGKSPISAALAVCGGVNVFADMPQLAAPIAAEAMLAVHPDVVLFGGDDSTASIRAYWSHLPGAPVTRYNTIYAVNADLLARATPRLLDGIEQVCGKLDAARHTLKNQ
jgi:ABC-type Fe3+-hydroxamate transport system substrate-binding protein